MAGQRENPEGKAAADAFRAAHPEGVVSGARIEAFRIGWAVDISCGEVAHYFRRETFSEARGACGLYAQTRWLHGQGNFPRCRKCQRWVDRHPLHRAP